MKMTGILQKMAEFKKRAESAKSKYLTNHLQYEGVYGLILSRITTFLLVFHIMYGSKGSCYG